MPLYYKELLSDEEHGGDDYYINVFKNSFRPGNKHFSCTYMIIVSDKNKTILINVNNDILDVEFGENIMRMLLRNLIRQCLMI